MFRLLFVCIWLALSFSLTWSQDSDKSAKDKTRSNLSGNWKLETNSPRQTPGSNDETILVIIHQEPEIRVIRGTLVDGKETKQEFIYYSDERGEKNQGITIRTLPGITEREIESETKWKGKKLSTHASVRRVSSGRLLTWNVISEWKLSTDTKTLTQTIRIDPENIPDITGPARARGLPSQVLIQTGPHEFKYVFRRIL